MDEAEYAAEPVSDAEKLAIASHMLMSSPPGQFWDVLADVKKLVPEGLLDDARAAEVAKAYNAQEGIIVEVGGEGSVLAAEATRAGKDFKDSRGGGVFAVDHVSAQVTGEGAAAEEEDGNEGLVDPALEAQRKCLEGELEAYRASFFSVAEKSAVSVFAKNGGLVAYLSSHKHNLKNWWSGKWSGRYTVTVSGGSAEVCGVISVRGHYFENGNIQLQTSKEIEAKTVTFTDPESLAVAVTTHIRQSESALHEGLEEMYEKMGDVTLRNMRRTKPITADRFTWNVAKIRMRNTLTQASGGK